jgi:hypothetical protein
MVYSPVAVSQARITLEPAGDVASTVCSDERTGALVRFRLHPSTFKLIASTHSQSAFLDGWRWPIGHF